MRWKEEKKWRSNKYELTSCECNNIISVQGQ